jgi:type II secretory pathway component PulK
MGIDMSGPEEQERLRRQRGRALVMALLLGAFVVLIYAISIVRIGQQ